MATELSDKHLKVFCLYVPAVFRELGDVFRSGDTAVQIMHSKAHPNGSLQEGDSACNDA